MLKECISLTETGEDLFSVIVSFTFVNTAVSCVCKIEQYLDSHKVCWEGDLNISWCPVTNWRCWHHAYWSLLCPQPQKAERKGSMHSNVARSFQCEAGGGAAEGLGLTHFSVCFSSKEMGQTQFTSTEFLVGRDFQNVPCKWFRLSVKFLICQQDQSLKNHVCCQIVLHLNSGSAFNRDKALVYLILFSYVSEWAPIAMPIFLFLFNSFQAVFFRVAVPLAWFKEIPVTAWFCSRLFQRWTCYPFLVNKVKRSPA